MKTDQFQALLTSEAIKGIGEQKFFYASYAQKINYEPLSKRWAAFGGYDGFISEFYKDDNNEVVYSEDFSDAVVFFKVEIVDGTTALIRQVGFDKCYNDDDEVIISTCEIENYDCNGKWHIGFSAFDALIDAMLIEATGTGNAEMVKAIEEFYAKNELAMDADGCIETHYFKRYLQMYNSDSSDHCVIGEKDNGKVIAKITL